MMNGKNYAFAWKFRRSRLHNSCSFCPSQLRRLNRRSPRPMNRRVLLQARTLGRTPRLPRSSSRSLSSSLLRLPRQVCRRRSLYRHSFSSRRLAIIQLRPAAPLKAVLSRALTLLRSFCNLRRRGSRTRSTGVTQKSELSSGTRNSRSSWLNCCSGMKWLSPKSALP